MPRRDIRMNISDFLGLRVRRRLPGRLRQPSEGLEGLAALGHRGNLAAAGEGAERPSEGD